MKKTATYTKKRHTYPAYKDSGIEWLGEIPEHWEVKRLKHSVALVNQKVDAENCNLPYTGLEQIESWTGKRVLSEGMVSSEGQASLYRKGDVLFGKLRPYLAKVLSVSESGICTGELLVLRPVYVLQQFLLGYLLNPDVISIVDSSTYGAKMPRANWDFIGNLPVVVPSTDEQRAIAAFLDRETVRIDGLIEKKQRQIELLQEKRAALISHAVTKGLNPNAKMKDSGIEWLGEIPEHWKLMRIGMISLSIQTGPFGSQLHSADYVDGGIPVINPANIQGGNIIADQRCAIDGPTYKRLFRHRLSTGDIVFGRRGEMGRCAMVTNESDGFLCGTGSLRIKLDERQVDPEFITMFLSTQGVRDHLTLESVGSTMDNLNTNILARIPVVIPPLDEQRSIRQYILANLHSTKRVVNTIQTSIDLLREYRTAVISAAVTGKIDVRGTV